MSQSRNQNKNRPKMVCYCNNISKETVEAAIRRGCHTLNKVFDATTAGVGPCGGSCRPYLAKMLESYLLHGKFPEDPRPRKK